MAGRPRRPEEEALPRAAPRTVASGDEVARAVLAPLTWGEAPQIGVLGDTGTGKTTAMREIVALYLQMSPGWALVVDDKERRARYPGQERRDVDDLRDHPVDPEGPRVVVFRGDVVAGVDADPEEVAELAWRRAGRGLASLVVHDELVAGREALCKSRQWRKGITWVPRSFTKGRAVGISDLWGAQSPQEVPIDPFEQSNAILCFKLDGMGLAKLAERNYLRGGADLVVPRLPGMEVPPAARGTFVLLRRGQDWDRRTYRFAVHQ